ncbi:integrator complex subunit 8-like [Oppia nitens]|uniref:integrator complex subunit 8-like n=1 Tax=Oppia nitens TaxID=1686743 RepID=UPI0023DB34BA|nr:integrator complex subunit 8-like [Oppia nitens]
MATITTTTTDIQSNGFQSSETKILWFEFLLQPKLLDTQLVSADKSSQHLFELISQLLTNALTISTTSLSSLTTTNTNGSNDETTSAVSSSQQQTVDSIKKAMDCKKSTAIRHLSFKIMAHLKWDLNLLETNLPPTQQDFLLSELIRYCDQNNSPTGCKLFACILYYRWILRYIIKSNYPLKPLKGPTIPLTLQQQIDPCFVSNEALDLLMKKLMDEYLIAVTDLEKVVYEQQKSSKVEILMPTNDCFAFTSGNEIVCHWNRCLKVHTIDIIDDILYDIGRWFFFREDYYKANRYFELISMNKRESMKHLNDLLTSTRDLVVELAHKDQDIEVIDFYKQSIDSLEDLLNGRTFDLSFFESLDSPEIIRILENAFKHNSNTKHRNKLIRLTKYLANKIKNLDPEVNKLLLFMKNDEKPMEVVIDSDNESDMYEEGEIDGDADDDIISKEPELVLLEATDPETIQDLVSKIKKHPLMINNKWILPLNQSKHLHNMSQTQYDKCHLILAKANQLRNAELFVESRILYLSLFEDIQASLPQLADVIKWEIFRTDMEYHFHTTDVDERHINDLRVKAINTLRTIDNLNLMKDWSELTELCCLFLLESFPQTLKDFNVSSVPLIKFSSAISWLAFDTSANGNTVVRAKDFWDMITNMFVDNNSNKLSTLLFSNSFTSFVSQFKDTTVITLIISCFSKLLNLIRDNSAQELTIPLQFNTLWPTSLVQSFIQSIDTNAVQLTLNKLLDQFLCQKPNEVYLLKCRAELCLMDGQFADAIKYFLLILTIKTKYFTCFSYSYTEEEPIIQRMIQCCVKMCCHTQAALLHQLTREPNYGLAFKALSERVCNDSCDDLYECIWDTTLLEFLINLHSRRGENERKTKAIQLMGQLELNANNSDVVLQEAAHIRRSKLLRILLRTYV